MDIPHRGSRAVTLPQIHVPDSIPSDRFRFSSRSTLNCTFSSPSSPSVPVPIPNIREPVPPPLPPPRHLADIEAGGSNGPDIAWRWGNSRRDAEWEGSSVTPGSSLYGSMASRTSMASEPSEPARRPSSTSTIKSPHGVESREMPFPKIDEGYSSLSSTSIESYRYVMVVCRERPCRLLTCSSSVPSIPTPRRSSPASKAPSTTSTEVTYRRTISLCYRSWILEGAVRAPHLPGCSLSLPLALRLTSPPRHA
jgi:hypothetical protein